MKNRPTLRASQRAGNGRVSRDHVIAKRLAEAYERVSELLAENAVLKVVKYQLSSKLNVANRTNDRLNAQVKELQAEVRELQAQVQVDQNVNGILKRRTLRSNERVYTDTLTGVLSRAGFEKAIKKISAYAKENVVTKGCVVVLDLDNFGAINKEHGQDAGDELLRQIYKKLWEMNVPLVRHDIARPGGDEAVGVLYDKRISSDPIESERRDREIDFETYAIDAVHKAIQEIAQTEFTIRSKTGDYIKIKIGISDGYAIIDDFSVEGIKSQLVVADSRAWDRKAGRQDFLDAYAQSQEVRDFYDAIPGFDEHHIPADAALPYKMRGEVVKAGQFMLDNDAGFRAILPFLSERALPWALQMMQAPVHRPPVDMGR